uniref:Uncharacterized protein n=1 Tax=Panagrolaimus sp. JU765 TaxID=591449 RepID=A0AC34RKI9_9BILA
MTRTGSGKGVGESPVSGVKPTIKKPKKHLVVPLTAKDKVTTVIDKVWYLDVEKAKRVVQRFKGTVDAETERKVLEATRGYNTKQLVNRVHQLERLVKEAGLDIPADPLDLRSIGKRPKKYKKSRNHHNDYQPLDVDIDHGDMEVDNTAEQQVPVQQAGNKHHFFDEDGNLISTQKCETESPMEIEDIDVSTGTNVVVPPAVEKTPNTPYDVEQQMYCLSINGDDPVNNSGGSNNSSGDEVEKGGKRKNILLSDDEPGQVAVQAKTTTKTAKPTRRGWGRRKL